MLIMQQTKQKIGKRKHSLGTYGFGCAQHQQGFWTAIPTNGLSYTLNCAPDSQTPSVPVNIRPLQCAYLSETHPGIQAADDPLAGAFGQPAAAAPARVGSGRAATLLRHNAALPDGRDSWKSALLPLRSAAMRPVTGKYLLLYCMQGQTPPDALQTRKRCTA